MQQGWTLRPIGAFLIMDFETFLSPLSVAFCAAPSRAAALERVGALLADATGCEPATVLAVLAKRERLGTTAFGNGTAVPHGRLPGLQSMAAAVVRLADPVDWNAVDGLPVDLVVALLAPDEAGAEPLKMLARVSRGLRDRDFVEKLRGASDAAALWALLVDARAPACAVGSKGGA